MKMYFRPMLIPDLLLFVEALQRELCPRIRLERVQELLEKQRALQQVLSLRLKELRRVCLQEAVSIGCRLGN